MFAAGTPDLNSLCVLLVASVILLSLVNKLPPMLAGIVGSAGQSAGIGSFGVGAAIGAATMVASTLASAGNSAIAGAREIAGGTSALTAAFKAAQADLDNATQDTEMIAGDSLQQQNMSIDPTKSALQQAMGTAKKDQDSDCTSRLSNALRVTAHAGSLLKENVARSMSDKISDVMASTTGGRLATVINEGREANTKSDNDSRHHESDEVYDFVNKRPPND